MSGTATTTVQNGHFVDEKSQYLDPKQPIYNNPNEKYDDDASSTASTLAAFPSSSTTQRYQLKYTDVLARHGSVTDLTTGLKIYTLEHHNRNPAFVLKDPEDRTLATAHTSKWTTRMDIHIANAAQDFELTPRHKVSSDVMYVSPAFGGATLSWRHGRSWTHVEYILTDQQGVPIAKFRGGSCWKCLPWGDFGTFEIFEGRGTLSEQQRDEVLATGTALSYRAAVNRTATVAPAVVVS